ncbi:hypothetical protein AMTR_s00032p00049160 [Amborella trichopoda]|uniref:Uncharacterized protein n=1 Tax=Amborella trichopoda TaxID=13333 RepID=U5CXT3_AMBTC|nr:hypothetical protein AMTR_s00032p00049160 [Amborella trichopoda]
MKTHHVAAQGLGGGGDTIGMDGIWRLGMEGMVVGIVTGNKGRDGNGVRLVGKFGIVVGKEGKEGRGGMLVGILGIVVGIEGIVVGIADIVEGTGSTRGKVRAAEGGVSNKRRAPKPLSNDRTTSIARRKLLLEPMAGERGEKMLEDRERELNRREG